MPRCSSAPPFSRSTGRLPSFLRLLLAAAIATAVASPAAAAVFGLTTEFDTGVMGSFGTVEVTESGGDLGFEIELTNVLGDDADLHEFYFNLAGAFTGVSISDTNAPNTAYVLSANPSVAGGAGSSFDYGVNLGNGAGPSGNGVLKLASFTIGADQDLSITDLIESSFAQGGTIEVNFAAHVQGTDFLMGSDSETVGGVVPEPSTALLFGLGLVALARLRGRSG